MLSLSKISYSIKRAFILKALDLSLELGESLILAGPNGSGKSTTLKILAGLLKPDSGAIQGYTRHDIGYLGEYPPLYEHLRVRDYLEFCAALHQIPPLSRSTQLDSVLDLLSLYTVEDQMIGTLSKGLKQRLGLAQAILHQPRVLLLDEPSAHLDLGQQALLLNCLLKLKKTCIMIISSHNADEISQLGDKILHFSNSAPASLTKHR